MALNSAPPLNFSAYTVEEYIDFLNRNDITEDRLGLEINMWAVGQWSNTYHWISVNFPDDTSERKKLIAAARKSHNDYYGKYSIDGFKDDIA